MTITKHFDTLKQAEKYQNLLYNKYHRVVLMNAPMFEESGNYVWEVDNQEIKG